MTSRIVLATMIASALALGACASSHVPVDDIATTEAAIRVAQEAGAESTPSAALHLHYARRERVEANQLIEGGDSKRAIYVLRRATADANLATALAHTASASRTTSIVVVDGAR